MPAYVADVSHPFGRMRMCHLWADTMEELYAMVDAIGVKRKWIQTPPKASWIHFDICVSKKKEAIKNGAILTDKYGPSLFVAKQHLERLLEEITQIEKGTARYAIVQESIKRKEDFIKQIEDSRARISNSAKAGQKASKAIPAKKTLATDTSQASLF